jgi:hypothetical protein
VENAPALKRKHLTVVRRFLLRLAKIDLDGLFGEPVGQLKILTDFSPFVAVFDRFFGVIIGLSEWMLRVPYSFIYRFHCLNHGSIPFSRLNHSGNCAKKEDRLNPAHFRSMPRFKRLYNKTELATCHSKKTTPPILKPHAFYYW